MLVVPGFPVRFQEDLETVWVLLALFVFAVLTVKHCQVLHGKNKPRRFNVFCFPFISNYSCFGLNIKNGKGSEVY